MCCILMQAQLSEQQAAVAERRSQFQQQQEDHARLQTKLDTGSRAAEAAAATAAQQIQQKEQVAHQLQKQLSAARGQKGALQDSCNAQAKQIADLGTQVSDAKASAQTLQVSLM